MDFLKPLNEGLKKEAQSRSGIYSAKGFLFLNSYVPQFTYFHLHWMAEQNLKMVKGKGD